jgi:RNA polymerase sigma-70 factor (ECF subfamily)
MMSVERGFDEFYLGTRSRVLTYLYSVGGDLTEAQDAAQEAYARAWQHWNTVSSAEQPEAWVRTVGWRLLAARWRSARARQRAFRRLGAPPPVPPPSEDTVTLVTALRQLPDAQRQAIVMHHLLDLPIVAIAAETGVAEGTIKARLSRGRTALAELLGSQLQEMDNA